jgi:oxaloacetate decarboxylase beta subunit
MYQLRPVTKKEKIIFPIASDDICCVDRSAAIPLVGMLMLGNLLKDRELLKAEQNGTERVDEYTHHIPRRICGCYHERRKLLQGGKRQEIGGRNSVCVWYIWRRFVGKQMTKLSGEDKPAHWSAGGSAVPMAARFAEVGRKLPFQLPADDAMGPNVFGVIGSGRCGGVLLRFSAPHDLVCRHRIVTFCANIEVYGITI